MAVTPRRAAVVGASAALVALIGVGVALADRRGDGDEAFPVADDPTTSTLADPASPASTTTSTTSTSTSIAAPVEPTTATATATAEPPPPPVDEPVDEPEPGCTSVTGEGTAARADWASWWQSEPAFNDPLTLELCVSDLAPSPGDEVSIDVSYADPDGPITGRHPRYGLWSPGYGHTAFVDFGNGDVWGERNPAWPGPPPAPVATPAETAGSASWSTGTVYAEPGTYVLTVVGYSIDVVDLETASPYASSAEATIVVTVG